MQDKQGAMGWTRALWRMFPLDGVQWTPLSSLGSRARSVKHWEWLAIFGLALSLRWLFLTANGSLLLPDSTDRYLRIAGHLFETWAGTVYDTPGYPAFLAIVTQLFGKGWPAIGFQAALDSLTPVLVLLVARQLGLNRSAFWLAVYFALHPGSILFANAVLAESLFCLLILVALFLFLSIQQSGIYGRVILLGVALSAIVLIRANGQLILLIFTVFMLWHPKVKWPVFLVYGLCSFTPVFAWVTYNSRVHQVPAIAQGGGWQWLQNMAFFELIDPATLPDEDQKHYRNWVSLGEMRARLSMDPSLPRAQVDSLFKGIAKQNFINDPLAYVLKMPRAFLLPRRFVKDTTRLAADATSWQVHNQALQEAGFGSYVKPQQRSRLVTLVYSSLRKLIIIPGKYSLCLLLTFGVLIWGWRQKNALVLLVAALPLGQFAALILMLNPIERYYFPFEPQMLMCIIMCFISIKRPKS